MLVSILIPCYNARRWLAQAIESALAQTWPEKEVVVVDDGSTDDSLAIVRSFGDQVRWESGPNRGGNQARNRLLELSEGEWLQYLDADDYLLPGKVAGQMDFLATHAKTDVVFGPVMMEHWAQNEIHRELLPIPKSHDLWVLLTRWYLPQTGALLWRKQAIKDVGGWKKDQPCCQEHELYLRMLMAGKNFTYCEVPGAVYRQWSDQTVCKRDVPEVCRRRLEIEQRAAEFLRSNESLTRERLHAINLARFEIARTVWNFSKAHALEIMALIESSEPDFEPDDSRAAPRRYRVALRIFGFGRTQRLAEWTRALSNTHAKQS